jgi:RNA polymerase sigma-70 factor (ECF subfamily)
MDTGNSFEKLYQDQAKHIYRFIYIKTSNKELTEDLTADTFCKYFEHQQKDPAIDNPRALLYKIASNLVIDSYRRKAYRESKIDADADTSSVPSDEDILSNHILKETYGVVTKAMKHIKKEYEDILLLHFIEDLTTTEIAYIQKTNENNIRVKVHRALKSLRGHLEDTA